MPVYNGLDGGVCWTYFHGPFDDSGWQSYVDHLAKLVDERPGHQLQRLATMVIVRKSMSPTAQQRHSLAAFMARHAGVMTKVTASAMVLDSAMARGALTALNWIYKKPFPEKIFARLDDSLAWLHDLDAEIDALAVKTALRATVPANQLFIDD